MRGAFPGLGKDPTPGDREAVAAHLEAAARALQQADEAASRLEEALDVSADWQGEAAVGFGQEGDDALLGLEAGKKSLAPVGKALNTWLRQLTANQQAADILEQDALSWKDQLAANPGKEEEERLNRELIKTFVLADKLAAKHKREADDAADAIEGAQADKAFVPVKTNDGMELLQDISTLSGEVSKWTATLGTVAAAVPGGQVASGPLLTVAAGAQGVKLLSDTGLILSGAPNAPKLYNVALDQAGGFTPVRWARGAVQGARAAKLARKQGTRIDEQREAIKGNPDPAKETSRQRRAAAAAIAGLPADGIDSYEKVTGQDLPRAFDAPKLLKPGVDVATGRDWSSVERAGDTGAKYIKGEVEKAQKKDD